MTKSQIMSWARQISTVLQTVNGITEGIDTLLGQHHVQSAVSNHKQVADIATELDRLRRDRDLIVADLLYRCNTTDVAGVEQRLTDVAARLDLANNLFEEWRRRLATYEHLATTDGFVDEPAPNKVTRAQMDTAVTELKAQYDQALENADSLVPNKPVVIA